MNSIELEISKRLCQIHNSTPINIFDIDDVKLQRLLDSPQGFNPNLLTNISCLVNSIIKEGLLREKITNIKPLGAKSKEADVFSCSLSPESNLFTIKVSKNAAKDNIIHEVLVGLSLNAIRGKIPNFMYVYGYFKCDPPVVYERDLISWCTSNINPITYLKIL